MTPVCLALLFGAILFGVQDDGNVTPVTQETINSEGLGVALFVAASTTAVGGSVLGARGAASAAAAACADGDCTNEASSVLQRAQKLLNGEPGYNIAAESTFGKYPQIGKVVPYITDKQAISDAIGEFEGREGTISVTTQQAAKLEQSLGLGEGTLANGFRISRVADVASRSPASPIVGNDLFLRPGQGLPGGGPELIIEPISTQIRSGIQQVIVIITGN